MRILDKIYFNLNDIAYNRVFILPILSLIYPIIATIIKLADLQLTHWTIALISAGLSGIVTTKFIDIYYTEKRKEQIMKQKVKEVKFKHFILISLILVGLFLLGLSIILSDIFIFKTGHPFKF